MKVSIGRNFCAMAIQMDCHFQMFRTRYGKRKRDRMKENERGKVYGIFKKNNMQQTWNNFRKTSF